eukprot:TRINITY_DN41755_c0_g1_i1.p1 TRINITY_DN41755_c0_g1~~TRINITY_DN41755_c0_g1_i1.p1  ORF type:complete len:1453 (+),score=233.52 TRINITY_DN41755_c0_g1_i1:244-4602(+)
MELNFFPRSQGGGGGQGRKLRGKRSSTACLDSDCVKADLKRYGEDPSYTGFFVDYLVRSRSDPTVAETAKWLLDMTPKQQLLASHTYSNAAELVKTERLRSKLLHIVTRHNKARSMPGWSRRQGKEIVRYGWQIVRMKSHLVGLSQEVNHWLDRFKLKHQPPAQESSQDKRKRLSPFWGMYHSNHKVIDGTLAGSSSPSIDEDSTGLAATLGSTVDRWKVRPAKTQGDHWNLTRATQGRVSPASTRGGSSCTAWELSRQLVNKRLSKSTGFGDANGALGSSRWTSSFQGSLPELFSQTRVSIVSSPSRTAGLVRGRSKLVQNHPGNLDISGASSPSATRVMSQSMSTPNMSMTLNPGTLGNQKTIASSSVSNLHGLRSQSSAGSPKQLTRLPVEAEPMMEPPEKRLNEMPYNKWGGIRAVKKAEEPTNVYLQACDANWTLPSLMRFCTGDSTTLDARGQALDDRNLQSVTQMIAGSRALDEVDLQGNSLLTERSLVPFLKELYGGPAVNLRFLGLSRCLRQTSRQGVQIVLDTLVDLLSRGVEKLKHLDLSGIPIGMKGHLPLCQAIKYHNTLQTLVLSEVGLGRNAQVVDCLSLIMSSSSVDNLDLSWNSFSPDVFGQFGELVVEGQTLTSLCVANCSASAATGENPAEFFLERLCGDKKLTYLDVSLNRIDFRGALILEAALEYHTKLSVLDVSHNPLSAIGFRSMLRLLSRSSTGLMHFHCENTANGSITEAAEEGFQVFSMTNPCGRYVLNLARPYDRALLRMLYESCEFFDLKPDDAFTNVTLLTGGEPFKHASRDSNRRWLVPTDGSVDLTFSIDAAVARMLKDAPEDDFTEVLLRYYKLTRLAPQFRKTIPLLSQWKSIEGLEIEQLIMLHALSKDFYLTSPQFAQACESSRSMVVRTAVHLIPCIIGGDPARFLSLLRVPTLGDYLEVSLQARRFFAFNAENPTGKYRLDLANSCDYAVAERLQLLDRWESGIATRRQLENTSKRGVRSQARNETYQERPLRGMLDVDSFAEFNMPEYGNLELDYVSNKRPSSRSTPIGDETLTEILRALHASHASEQHQIDALGMVAHHFYLSSLQLRGFVQQFKTSRSQPRRSELVVRLFMRVSDMHNEKVFRALFTDIADFHQLQWRLGYVTYFPFMQPEQAHFEMDFSIYDQRLAANVLVTLAAKESRDNIKDASHSLPDGTVDSLLFGVPRLWEQFDKMPIEGIFRATYVCAPENRKFADRAALLERFGYWKAPEEEDVSWWATLHDSPRDVVSFVEFCYSRFKSVWPPFDIICSPESSDQASARDFEDGLDAINCHKFDGKDKKERIAGIIRYLDPSGEEQVTRAAWGMLELLLKENQLHIREFAEFCVRMFGDLKPAWRELKNASGDVGDDVQALTLEQWSVSCKAIGYHGPSSPIFNFLDDAETGNVGLEQFITLSSVLQETQAGSVDASELPLSP